MKNPQTNRKNLYYKEKVYFKRFETLLYYYSNLNDFHSSLRKRLVEHCQNLLYKANIKYRFYKINTGCALRLTSVLIQSCLNYISFILVFSFIKIQELCSFIKFGNVSMKYSLFISTNHTMYSLNLLSFNETETLISKLYSKMFQIFYFGFKSTSLGKLL